MDRTCLLEASNVGLHLGDREVLKQVSLKVHAGQIITLIGPNGAGKTTLVRVLLGLLKAQTGLVTRRQGLRIGYMPQKMQVVPTMPISVSRFLRLACHADHRRLNDILAELKISHLEDRQLGNLSGGELQRVLLARALSQSPQLLVLDEPAQGVDVTGQEELYQLIDDIRTRHQCGVLMISHDLHLVMATTDEVVCLNQHICCSGHPQQVSVDPAYIALFGKAAGGNLAVYAHQHNHHHDITGCVVEEADHHHD